MQQESATADGPGKKRVGNMAVHNWLGVPSILAALAANWRFFFARRPGTPLRVLAMIAIDAAMKSRGLAMREEQRRGLVEALELGALLNDRFDGDIHDIGALRAAVSWFKKSEYRKVAGCYAKRLRRLERTRPAASEGIPAVKCYRENVNHVSLTFLWAVARAGDFASAEQEIRHEPDLRLLYQIVMQCQLMDDLFDVRADRSRGLPSFATGPEVTAVSLHELVSVYSDPMCIRLDRNFCLRVALKVVGTCLRWVISMRLA